MIDDVNRRNVHYELSGLEHIKGKKTQDEENGNKDYIYEYKNLKCALLV